MYRYFGLTANLARSSCLLNMQFKNRCSSDISWTLFGDRSSRSGEGPLGWRNAECWLKDLTVTGGVEARLLLLYRLGFWISL